MYLKLGRSVYATASVHNLTFAADYSWQLNYLVNSGVTSQAFPHALRAGPIKVRPLINSEMNATSNITLATYSSGLKFIWHNPETIYTLNSHSIFTLYVLRWYSHEVTSMSLTVTRGSGSQLVISAVETTFTGEWRFNEGWIRRNSCGDGTICFLKVKRYSSRYLKRYIMFLEKSRSYLQLKNRKTVC